MSHVVSGWLGKTVGFRLYVNGRGDGSRPKWHNGKKKCFWA